MSIKNKLIFKKKKPILIKAKNLIYISLDKISKSDVKLLDIFS